MNVLIACEFSGRVREAFRRYGHNAYSCDLLPADDESIYHFQTDVCSILKRTEWDLMIAHPPCTYLTNSGALHLYNSDGSINNERWKNMELAAEFFMMLWNAPIKMKCIENPIMVGHAKQFANIPKQSQIVQPWMFGHPEMKATCFWLQGLPLLRPTKIIEPPYEAKVHRMAPGPERSKLRSLTYQGIADAMGFQWGAPVWR